MLEWLRLTRNAVAHQFGLEGDTRFIEQVDASYFAKSNITVTAAKVKGTLKIIREVVDEVETKISGPNIGIFEMLLFIHNFKNDVDDFKSKMPAKYKNATLEKMLSIFSLDAGLQNVSRVDARELIKFYNNA